MAERRDGAPARTLGRRWYPLHTPLPARLFDLPARYALIAAGGALLLFATHESAGEVRPGPQVAHTLLTLLPATASLLCFILAAIRIRIPPLARRVYAYVRYLAVAAALALTLFTAALFLGGARTVLTAPLAQAYRIDVISFSSTNADLALAGQNPYTSDAAYRDALRRFPITVGTPLRAGSFGTGYDYPTLATLYQVTWRYLGNPAALHGEFDPATLHSYPALSFLLYVPLLAFGVRDILALHLLIFLGLLVWLVRVSLPRMSWWAGLTATSATIIVNHSIFVDTEIICIAFLLLAWHYRKHWLLSVVLLGLGCAFKQYVWFFVPFFLADALAAYGWRDTLRRAAVMAAVFLLPNLPYLIMSPGAWWHSMWLPMSLPAFPAGLGIILLSTGHLLPYFPPLPYTLLEGATLAGLLWAFIRWRPALDQAALLLPLVPLFFAFRSSANYFAVAPWLALYAASALYAARHTATRSPAAVRVPITA